MKWLHNLIKSNTPATKAVDAAKYAGFSDFFHRAPYPEKIDIFTEAARRANLDQRKTLEKAGTTT